MAEVRAVIAAWADSLVLRLRLDGRLRPYSRSWVTSVSPFTVLTVRITPLLRPRDASTSVELLVDTAARPLFTLGSESSSINASEVDGVMLSWLVEPSAITLALPAPP